VKVINETGWVDTDGSYGVGCLILFDPDDLTPDQWETLSNLGDNSRYDYVQAIMNNEPLDEWEGDDADY
jgi:hypothetical protein